MFTFSADKGTGNSWYLGVACLKFWCTLSLLLFNITIVHVGMCTCTIDDWSLPPQSEPNVCDRQTTTEVHSKEFHLCS